MHRALTLLLLACVHGFSSTNFINFETAPVHPVALSPSGARLALCNLADGRVEFFTPGDAEITHTGSVPVGIDPVTVRFRTETELWVINAISDSIDVLDAETRSVRRVIPTADGPADVVFAGSPQRAYVSCPPENLVLVIHPDTGVVEQRFAIPAQRPKAMAVSPDGSRVYVAIFESGNGTTILAPRLTELGRHPPAGSVDLPLGPYAGLNPPPNSGTLFDPPLGTNLPASNPPPRVSLIVKREPDGRWLDDNDGDWTSFISGTNAAFSGRTQGWELIDHDIAIIEAGTTNLTFIDALLNIGMDVAVDPVSGQVALVGTDAINHVRYEPVLQSVFTRINLALADPGGGHEPLIMDVNPHLDYRERSIPVEERKASVGDPRGLAWNGEGTRLYVTGMGSDNIAMLDRSGHRVATTSLPSGPSGVVFDPYRKRLYVLNRFAASISVVDANDLNVLQTVPFFDPTPEVIKKGRPHFYNTTKSSGLGQAACASCHVDGRFDRLAWDLGTPLGSMKALTSSNNFGALTPATNAFHPMKGPMVTQTLQDIIGHEPFHWRGDRDGLEEFNPTFTDLQGADEELSDSEMQEFEDFLATIVFPPNRFRAFENTLQSSVPTGEKALGRGRLPKGAPLPRGNALEGFNFFRSLGAACNQCHALPSGAGPERVFRNGRWTLIPIGPKGEHHIGMAAVERSDFLPFKIAQLRSLPDKLGFRSSGPSESGFGFFHDGRVDSLTRFLQDGFGITDDAQTANLVAFLLSFSGSDLTAPTILTDSTVVPPGSSHDAPAALGRQLLLEVDSSALGNFIARARDSDGRVDLVARRLVAGVNRGWVFDAATALFIGDTAAARAARTDFFNNVTNTGPVLFTLVAKGTGRRLGIDRDEDGFLDFDELVAGSDPADPASTPSLDVRFTSVSIAGDEIRFLWQAGRVVQTKLWMKHDLRESTWVEVPGSQMSGAAGTNSAAFSRETARAYFRLQMSP